jgi:predicted  nucleic acid-binding Zn-ribbon protein
MNEDLRLLWSLQEEDTRLRELGAGLARIPGQLRVLEERLTAERGALDQAVARIKQVQLDRRAREKEIESFAEQERKFQQQLFQVKTNQEYQALLHEIEAVKQKRSQIETQVLEGLEEEERLAGSKAEHERAAAEARRLGEGRRAELLAEQARLEEQAARVRAARDELTSRLRPNLRARYERIHAALDGLAVVPVVRNACGGCMRQLPPQRVQEARLQEMVVVCDGCGRIVLWPPSSS